MDHHVLMPLLESHESWSMITIYESFFAHDIGKKGNIDLTGNKGLVLPEKQRRNFRFILKDEN